MQNKIIEYAIIETNLLQMEKKMKYISNSEKDTIELGKKIASQLQIGDIIILSGDLGSGKTKLTEGILTYFNLSIKKPVVMHDHR